MESLLQGLRAAAEGTRLRILGLCAHAELTVSELVEILGQSQPRVSRHLRLLVESGLLERHREGNWACYRLCEAPDGGAADGGALGRVIADLLDSADPAHARDLARLEAVQADWTVKAAAYFQKHAPDWGRVSALHLDDAKIDAALRNLLSAAPLGDLLDIGTGTGRVLQLLGREADSGIGIDRSIDMLKFARANIWRAGLRNCQVRLADMNRLPFAHAQFDTVTLRMALHYAERPAWVIAEAARVLRPGGRLVVIDLEPHGRTELRDDHAHRWLGFADEKIRGFFERANLVVGKPVRLLGGPLTVGLWSARQPANDAQSRVPAQAAS